MNANNVTTLIPATQLPQFEPAEHSTVAHQPKMEKSKRAQLQRGLLFGVALAAAAFALTATSSLRELETSLAKIQANFMNSGYPTDH